MGKGGDGRTKADIVEKSHRRVGVSKKEIDSIVESAFDIIKETLEREDKIVISKCGDFIIRSKRPRRARNPQTGESLEISARRILTFKPSEVLRASLNSPAETSASDQG